MKNIWKGMRPLLVRFLPKGFPVQCKHRRDVARYVSNPPPNAYQFAVRENFFKAEMIPPNGLRPFQNKMEY